MCLLISHKLLKLTFQAEIKEPLKLWKESAQTDLRNPNPMPPKKKGGKKKGGKSGGKKGGLTSADLEALSQQYRLPPVSFNNDQWVTLNVKLFTWDYMNFSMTVPTSTRLFTLQDRIAQRHGGSVANLTIFKDQASRFPSCLSRESSSLLMIATLSLKFNHSHILKFQVHPKNLLTNPEHTLEQLGIRGGQEKANRGAS